MNDNKKIRAPKLAMTPQLMKAGLDALTTVMAHDDAEDDHLVAAIFLAMWNEYWISAETIRRKKATIHPLIQPVKSKLILPTGA